MVVISWALISLPFLIALCITIRLSTTSLLVQYLSLQPLFPFLFILLLSLPQLLILLTDVDGLYDRPPSHPQARIIQTYNHRTGFEVGAKSLQGRGGMAAKVDAALK